MLFEIDRRITPTKILKLVYFTIVHHGIRKQFSTSTYVKPQFWDKASYRLNLKDPTAYSINHKLNNIYDKALQKYSELTAETNRFDITELYQYVERLLENKSNNFFIELENYIRNAKLTVNSKTVFTGLIKSLHQFEAEANCKLKFENLNQTFSSKYIDFCNSKGYKFATIKLRLNCLCIFLNYAFINKISYFDNSKSIKSVLKNYDNDKTEKQIISEADFKRLYEMDCNDYDLMKAKDRFIFSALTCQRISDILQIDKSDIQTYNDCYYWNVKQMKTNKKTTIRLNKLAMDILEKYNYCFYTQSKRLINNSTNEVEANKILKNEVYKINLQLKKISKELDAKPQILSIEENNNGYIVLTNHTARHIGISFLRNNGMNTDRVEYISGHSTKSISSGYTHLNRVDIANEANAIFENVLKIA